MDIQTHQMTQGEEIEQIEVALDELLTAIHQHHARSGPLRAKALVVAPGDAPPSDIAHDAWRILENPIDKALSDAVAILGLRLHELGGEGLMSQALELLVAAKRVTEPWRRDILGAEWIGIGQWLSIIAP